MVRPDSRQPVLAAVAGSGGNPYRLRRLTLEAPRDDEVLVRIVACGICHTDVDMAEGCAAPAVFGHEGAGVVMRVGKSVSRLKPGDSVVLSFASCGRCAACEAGRPADCDHFMTLNFGGSRLDGSNGFEENVSGHFFGQSSFATYALATERNAVKIDASLPLDVMAPLGCGLQTGAGTVIHSLAVSRGQSLVIAGAGSVGLGALMAARIQGASRRIVVEPVAERRRLALELGATAAFSPEQALAGAIRAGLPEGADGLVDTAGDPTLHRAIPDWLSDRGRVAWLTGGPGAPLKPGQHGRPVIQGDADPQRFIPAMIGWYRAGDFPVQKLIRRYPFEAINQAHADAAAGRVIKAVLIMS